jgi:predicted metal-dependent phosphoesterase TrpH
MKPNLLLILSGLFFISTSVRSQVSIGGYNVYYGHIHNHCNFSDGTGTVTQAYTYARDNGKLDFFSLADHDTQLTSEEYTTMISTANSFNQDGSFVTFYGFEWSHATYGHVAVIGSHDYCSSASSEANTFSELVTWLSSRDAVAFFNHPGRQNSTGVEFEHFTTVPSEKFVGMELWNKTDLYNVYYYTDGYFTNDGNKSWYDEALIRGWKIGAAGAEDNHSGTFGTMTPAKMAVLGTAKTRTDIMNAIKARRFYSTLDKDLGLSFKINGAEIGSTLPGGTWTLQILASDGTSDVFSQVQLLKNGAVINTWTPNTTSVNISQSISCSDGEYYYVRVKQTDGGEAVSSPIWIVGGTVNVSPTINLTAPANNSTYEEPASVTISADASDTDGSVTKVEFFQGLTWLGEDTSSPYSFTWSGVTAGNYMISARATDNLGAVTVSTAVSVAVVDPNAPLTVSSVIASGTDDAEESATGSVNTTSTDLELINDSGTGAGDQTVGMRFINLMIPQGAQISNAYIQFTCDETNNLNTCSLTIKGEKSAGSTTFSATSGNISERVKTTASVSWSPPDWTTAGLAGTAQRTPQLSAVIQEIVSLPAFTTGSPVTLIITGTGRRTAEAYDGVPASAPKLVVEFNLQQPVTPTFTQIGPLYQGKTAPSLPLTSINGITGTWSPATISTVVLGSSTYVFTPNAGQCATAASMQIEVLAPAFPQVFITSPASSTTFTAPATITITATASDADGSVVNVAFYQGTTLLGNITSAPYTFAWTGVPQGTYQLTAEARDNDGQETTSADVSITVNAPVLPQIFEKRIIVGTDDAEEYNAGTMLLNSDDIELVYDTKTTGNQKVGLRFQGITIPKGATITNAYIRFTTDEIKTGTTSLLIQGQNADNAATFTTAKKNISGRTKTAAFVSWSPSGWSSAGASGTLQTTPELKSIIQEIINRSGWASGNSMAFIISGTGTRTAVAFETSPAGSAMLHIEWSVAAASAIKSAPVHDRESLNSGVGKGKLTCYPIPFSRNFNIIFEPGENEVIGKIEIIHSTGAVVKILEASQNYMSIDMTGYPAGIYLLGVQTNKTRYVKTLVKQ